MTAQEIRQQIEDMKAAVREHGGNVIEAQAKVDFLSQGLLIRVSVHGVGVFDRRLSLEELGISSRDEELARYIRAGSKSYAPEYSKRLASWGTQCRQLAAKYAMKLESVDALTASRSWRFLHFDAYDDFKQEWDTLQRQRDTIVRDIEREYDLLVEEAVEFYQEQFGRSFHLLQSRYTDIGGVAVHIPGTDLTFGPHQHEQYVEWVGQHVREDFPTLEDIRRSIHAEYYVNILFDPASLAETAAAEQEARAREAEARARAARAEDEAWTAQMTREARAEAIRRAEMERMRKAIQDMADPFAEAMDQLLHELAQNIEALVKGFQKNGTYKGRALERLDRMEQLFRIMGGHNLGDAEMERLLADLRAHKDQNPTTETARETWVQRINEGLAELRERVEVNSTVIARQLQAHTRAGALEL